ncbi:MAG: alpha/beta fold hydrolase [Chloroflexi bacterium]|nr:alpha/beta fold hydrolase [Chloroflexota bacterium]
MPSVPINGSNIYYEVHGTGSPLVLSHTGWTSVENWKAVLPGLARRYQVVVYDRRGCGRSSGPEGDHSAAQWLEDLHKLLGHLDIDRAYVGGVSYGAFLSLEFALAYPEMTAAALLVCGTTEGWGDGRPDAIPFPDRRDRLPEIRCPVLLVQGAQDRWFPPELGQRAKAALVNSRLAEVAVLDSGHSPQVEVPEAFKKTLLDFLAKADRLRHAK